MIIIIDNILVTFHRAIQVRNSAPDSEIRSLIRQAETAIAEIARNGRQDQEEVISNAIEEAKKDLNRIKQDWQGKVTTDGHHNLLGICVGEMGHSGSVDQTWDKDVNTTGDNNDIGYSGETGNITQHWKEDVTSKGNDNRVGINRIRR